MASTITDTPPPSHSPPKHRSPKKQSRKSDPFLELPDLPAWGTSSPFSTPGEESDDPFAASHAEPLLSRLILTPLYFTSFLLSLLLVDRRNRAWRASQHPTAPGSARSALSTWLDPQPYQDHSCSGPTQPEPSGDGTADPAPHRTQRPERWYTRKKHRKIAKLEFGDAFELRGRVIAAMAVCWVVVVLGMGWVVRRAWVWGFGA